MTVCILLLAFAQDWNVIASPVGSNGEPAAVEWVVLQPPAAEPELAPVEWSILQADHCEQPVQAAVPSVAKIAKEIADLHDLVVSHIAATVREAHPLTKAPSGPKPDEKPTEQPAARIEPTVQLIEEPTYAAPVCRDGRCVPQPMHRGLFRRR